MLDEVVESVVSQTVPPRDVIVVLDDPKLEWLPKRAGIRVLHSKRNEGKVSATVAGCQAADGDLILSVDDDTILAPSCVEHLKLHLQDEILAVCARIEPIDTSTWIGRAREDMYRKSHTRPGLINGACFLMRKSSFEEFYASLTTMVEDQELTRILNKPYRRWMVCQEARVKTSEPNSLARLFHQLVRWGYGTRELDAKEKGGGYRTVITAGLLIPVVSVVESSARGLEEVVAAVIFWSFLLLVPITILQFRRYNSKGASTWRLAAYSFIEVVSLVVAAIRYALHWKPKW
jgi:cellulose synthase/poly-beta-1,6-N-acetylglucosamine synthase-like glycosyltransferase